MGNGNGDTTAMDELFAHMAADQTVCNDKVEKIKKIVKTERFDSDSLLNEDGMAHFEEEKECAQSIRAFVQWIKRKTANFSVGHRFYYWPYYEHLPALLESEQIIYGGADNDHDHSGVAVSQLF